MSEMKREEAPRSPKTTKTPKIESKRVSRKASKDMANTGQSFHGKHAEFADSVADGSDSMAMSVHSPMYNQITNIPTVDYALLSRSKTSRDCLKIWRLAEAWQP